MPAAGGSGSTSRYGEALLGEEAPPCDWPSLGLMEETVGVSLPETGHGAVPVLTQGWAGLCCHGDPGVCMASVTSASGPLCQGVGWTGAFL